MNDEEWEGATVGMLGFESSPAGALRRGPV
jgi:hypothetical protein